MVSKARKNKLNVISDLYKGSPIVMKRRLKNNGITDARAKQIRDAAIADSERDWTVAREVPTDGPIDVYTFLHSLWTHDKRSVETANAAYGDWSPARLAKYKKPPRAGALYFMFAHFFGDGDANCDGKYGDWENDIRPALEKLDELVESRVNLGGIDHVERPLQWLSVALERACCFDHENNESGACYQRLQSTKLDAEQLTALRLQQYADDLVVIPWDTLVERVREEFGSLSKESMYIELFTTFPSRDDLNALMINPSEEEGNFIRIRSDGGEFVKSDYKTRNLYGAREYPMNANLCASIRAFMNEHGLVDGDYLLGHEKHSPWVGRFLTKIGVKTAEWKGRNIHLLRHVWLSSARADIKRKFPDDKERQRHCQQELCKCMDHSPEAALKYINEIVTP